ncbi:MAG: hypothetical protein QF662_01120 [Phycisphaerae bacterium]|nr:hypothetical protein [Phycisphaerae bacterium]
MEQSAAEAGNAMHALPAAGGIAAMVLSCVFMVASLAAAVLGIIAFFQVLSLKKEVRRLAGLIEAPPVPVQRTEEP